MLLQVQLFVVLHLIIRLGTFLLFHLTLQVKVPSELVFLYVVVLLLLYTLHMLHYHKLFYLVIV